MKKKRLALKGYSITDPSWLRGYSYEADLEALSFREANARKREVEKDLLMLKARGMQWQRTPRKRFDLKRQKPPFNSDESSPNR